MNYLLTYTWIDCLLAGLLGAFFLFELYYYIRYMAGIQRRMRHDRRAAQTAAPADAAEEENLPGVSVVVCARNESDNLRNYLHALTCQQYPRFEVIVVNDASQDNTQYVLEHYAQLFPNLRLTFVPADAWVRSSKKLALTLAAKAARYDYLLLTDADCRPESPHWIREMMRGFLTPRKEGETEIVLGYGAYFNEDSRVNRLIQYDTIWNAMQYLGMALSRHPYMGVGRNLAYRKDTFFRNHGFQGMLGEKAGDDDLFVNKIASRHNTAVVLTPDSFTWSVPKQTYKEWRMQKYRHLSVSPAYKLSTRLRLTLEPAVRGLFYLLTLAIILLGAFQVNFCPILWAITLLLFMARWIMITAMMTRAGHLLGGRGFSMAEVLRYDILLPLNTLIQLARHRLRRKQELKWN